LIYFPKKGLSFSVSLSLRLLNAIIISRLSSFGNAHFLVHFSFSKYLMYFLLFQAKVYVSSSFFLSLFHKNFAKVKKIFVKIKPWDKKLTTFEYLLFAFPLSLKCNWIFHCLFGFFIHSHFLYILEERQVFKQALTRPARIPLKVQRQSIDDNYPIPVKVLIKCLNTYPLLFAIILLLIIAQETKFYSAFEKFALAN